MANASPLAARMGWELYRQSGFRLAKDELVARLREGGYGRVSDRMYRHYRALVAAGYDHYVPINRFDVARAARPFEGDASSNLYDFLDVSYPVQVTVVKRSEPYVLMARTQKLSDASASLIVEDPATVNSLPDAKLKARDYARMDFLTRPEVFHGKLVAGPDIDEDATAAFIDIEFSRLHSLSDFAPSGEGLRQTRLRVVVSTAGNEPDVALDVLGRRFFHLFEVIEVCRALVNETVRGTGRRYQDAVRPFRVDRVQMRSPLQLVLDGVPAVLAIAVAVIGAVPSVTVLGRQYQEMRLASANVRHRNAQSERLEIENTKLRSEAETAELIQQIVRDSLTSVTDLPETGDVMTARFRNLATKKLAAAVDGLILQDVDGLTVSELGPDDGLETDS